VSRQLPVLVRQQARLLRQDPVPVVVLTAMPLLLAAFIKPAFRPALLAAGQRGANGAEQAVPGMAIMFGYFLLFTIGFAVFREHGWHTWDRLRAAPATTADVIGAFTCFPLFVVVAQQAIVFAVGSVVFDLHVRGSVLALAMIGGCSAFTVVALGWCMVAVCRSAMQLNAVANLVALLLAGLGGALTPRSALPGWVGSIAPATPSYWAMRGYQQVIVGGAGVRGALVSSAVLVAFGIGLSIVAILRFRVGDEKESFA